jgi:hypothetical protein
MAVRLHRRGRLTAPDPNRALHGGRCRRHETVAVSKAMPLWNPDNPVDKLRDFRGTLEP